MISRRSLLLAGAAFPVVARAQCVTDTPAVDACRGGVRITAQGPPGATLDLSFMTPGTLDPRITFTRASIGTYYDVAGVLQTATANTPRWDYDPVTHALRGLLIEEQRINVLLNSATLGTQSVTVTAVATTLSFYGTGTVTLSGVSTAGPLTGTGAFPTRVALTFTPTAGTLTLTVTGSVLNAQLEAGAFATSVIPTTAAAVTRSADVAYIPTASFPYQTTYSLFVAFDTVSSTTSAIRAGVSDAVFNNAAYIAGNAFNRTGPGGAGANGTPLVLPGSHKQAGTVSATTVRACNNGTATVGSSAVTAPLQTTATRLSIGCGPWALDNQCNGHVRQITYWPRELTNAELQQVTT